MSHKNKQIKTEKYYVIIFKFLERGCQVIRYLLWEMLWTMLNMIATLRLLYKFSWSHVVSELNVSRYYSSFYFTLATCGAADAAYNSTPSYLCIHPQKRPLKMIIASLVVFTMWELTKDCLLKKIRMKLLNTLIIIIISFSTLRFDVTHACQKR